MGELTILQIIIGFILGMAPVWIGLGVVIYLAELDNYRYQEELEKRWNLIKND